MNSKKYLLNVLGLSAVPRIISSLYTLISLPIMLRAVGAEEYGKVLYYGAVIAILEAFVDFGVSSAAGKELSSARVSRPGRLLVEFLSWARMQLSISLIGIVPLFIVSYFVIYSSDKIEFNLTILILVVASAWLAICSNFIRAALTAMLGFKPLALLDTYQSLFRSTSFLFVAFMMPSAMGVVVAGFVTALTTAIIAVIIVMLLIKQKKYASPRYNNHNEAGLTQKEMIRESLYFFWLRLAVRSFDSIPVFLFGRLLGAEVVGVVGAVAKLLELITFPFAVIGNALSVQAQSIIIQEVDTITAFWDAIMRFISLALFGVAFLVLGHDYLSILLLPKSDIAPLLVFAMSLQVLTIAISSIVGPVSDYVGALKQRNILLTIMTFLQIPVIWVAAWIGGAIGGISAYLIILLSMNWGYMRIALGLFFNNNRYQIRKEIRLFAIFTILSLIFAMVIKVQIITFFGFSAQSILTFIICFLTFIVAVVSSVVAHPELRAYYINERFFNFLK